MRPQVIIGENREDGCAGGDQGLITVRLGIWKLTRTYRTLAQAREVAEMLRGTLKGREGKEAMGVARAWFITKRNDFVWARDPSFVEDMQKEYERMYG
jgi:hypothetical protein